MRRGFTGRRTVMHVTVQRLIGGVRAALAVHFLGLTAEDRRLRFGSSISTEAIAAYFDGIDFDHDAVFGVHDDRLALVGVAHVAFAHDLAELGLSVLPAHRGRGVGSALFGRAVAHARNRCIPKFFMHCLTENVPIMRMAQRFDMDIVTSAGDSDAHIDLPPASPASITGEFVTDRLALYDYALKAHVAAWKRINAALEGTARPPGPGRVCTS